MSTCPLLPSSSTRATAAPAVLEPRAGRGPVQRRADRGAGYAAQCAALRPGAASLAVQLAELAPAKGGRDGGDGVLAAAAQGVQGSGGPLPHLGAIQASFGRHDVRAVQAYHGGGAAAACEAMGAEAYATGARVAFGGSASLHTAAHEAAHVVQQRGGVQLAGGVGQAGDRYERHADAVADRVVQGKSAEGLLDQMAGGGGAAGGAGVAQQLAVQRRQSLGAVSWQTLSGAQRAIEVVTMTEEEWRETLQNCDDEDEVLAIEGFVTMAATGALQVPAGGRSTVARAPSEAEILRFMRALYGLGGDLDLPDAFGEAWENGPIVQSFRVSLAQLIQRYQGKMLLRQAERNEVLTPEGVGAVVTQGDDLRITSAMLTNAVATATAALAVLAEVPEGTPGAVGFTHGLDLLRKCGATARYAATTHAANEAARTALMQQIFGVAWSMVPGSGLVRSPVKAALQVGAVRSIAAMSTGTDVTSRLENLRAEFLAAGNEVLLACARPTGADADAEGAPACTAKVSEGVMVRVQAGMNAFAAMS